jgi:phytoene synthase
MLRPLPDGVHASPADLAICRQMIRDGSKTFYAASRLLPHRVRDAALSLYGFCRAADDLVDKSQDISAAVASLQERLDGIYGGSPSTIPADRAFADVAAEYEIPRALPEGLIEGFAWDAKNKSYDTVDDLIAYAVRVAGAVGAMMAIIMNRREPDAVARACDLGIAMQLTNIARDIGEDARMGRLYIPRQWLAEAGIDADRWLARPHHDERWAGVARRLLALADDFYASASHGVEILPAACRPAIRAAHAMYREIGRQVERNGYNSIDRRAVVSTARKARLLCRSALPSRSGGSSQQLAHPEAQFVIDAVAAAPLPEEALRGFDGRMAWIVNLFTRLEAAKR